MVLGDPEEKWPWLHIDADTCIDRGAFVPECPYDAIFPEEEAPFDFVTLPLTWIANTVKLLPDGQPFESEFDRQSVMVLNANRLEGGKVFDFARDFAPKYEFYLDGPGNGALDMD